MKNIRYLLRTVSAPLVSAILACLCQEAKSENDKPEDRLTQLVQRIKNDTGALPDETFARDTESFAALLPEISFAPNFDALPDINAATPNGSDSIRAATSFVVAILRSENLKKSKVNASDSPALIAIDLYVKKLDSAIDPNWKTLPVLANVSPPSGTPNAAAGMNPEAIQDPELKQQYLNLIKQNKNNNLINGQQRELRMARLKFLIMISNLVATTSGQGWNKADVIARFCKGEESRRILEENLK